MVKVPQFLFYPSCWVEYTLEGFSDAHWKREIMSDLTLILYWEFAQV